MNTFRVAAFFLFLSAGMWFFLALFGENKVTGDLLYVMRAIAINSAITSLVGGLILWRLT